MLVEGCRDADENGRQAEKSVVAVNRPAAVSWAMSAEAMCRM